MTVRSLCKEEREAFAREFKAARALALKDAEEFDELLFALERLGSYITITQKGLGHYEPKLREMASQSALFEQAPDQFPIFHLHFDTLYESVRIGRNDALHQGAVARHLARNAQELALILEDALMTQAKTAAEFMVRDPVCAELWYPLTSVRRTMLLNAFSYLPYRHPGSNKWRLVSDRNLVTFLRPAENDRDKRLLMTLEEALTTGLQDIQPPFCNLSDPVSELASKIDEVPYLVLSNQEQLCGIITAFDLL